MIWCFERERARSLSAGKELSDLSEPSFLSFFFDLPAVSAVGGAARRRISFSVLCLLDCW